jgi:hypothetical protein
MSSEEESNSEAGSEGSEAEEEEENSEKESENEGSEEGEENKEEENEDNEENEDKSEEEEVEKEGKKEKEKGKSVKFNEKQLVLTNEIKIDLNTLSDPFLTSLPNNTGIIKTKKSLQFINQINENLDEIFENLSKTIKSFNNNSERNRINEKSFREEKRRSPSPYRSPKKEYQFQEPSDDEYENIERNKFIPSSKNTKKFYSDKEINTEKIMKQKQSDKYMPNPNPYKINNMQQNSKFTSQNNNYRISPQRNPRKPENNFRTVEDLYRHKQGAPIIYNTGGRNYYQNQNQGKEQVMNNKTYKKERDEQGFMPKNDINIRSQTMRPKNINQAIDILLDNNE